MVKKNSFIVEFANFLIRKILIFSVKFIFLLFVKFFQHDNLRLQSYMFHYYKFLQVSLLGVDELLQQLLSLYLKLLKTFNNLTEKREREEEEEKRKGGRERERQERKE